MRTNYIIDNDKLVINLNFLYDIEFNNNLNDIYKYINNIIEKYKISFFGRKILLYVNGIFLGTLYLTNYYLKDYFKIKKKLIDDTNSYFIPSLILEL